MFANFTEETCTGTTGDITVTGATEGNLPFSARFPSSFYVHYVIEDGNGVNKCSGVGIFDGVDTLVRTDRWTWDGTTYDRYPSGNLTLSSETHIIRVSFATEDIERWETKNSWNDLVDADIIPDVNNLYRIGTDPKRFTSGYINTLYSSTLNCGHLHVASHATPSNTAIGQSSRRFNDLYIKNIDASGDITITGNIHMDSFGTVDGRDLSVDGSKLDILDTGGASDGDVLVYNSSTGLWESTQLEVPPPKYIATLNGTGGTGAITGIGSSWTAIHIGNIQAYSGGSDFTASLNGKVITVKQAGTYEIHVDFGGIRTAGSGIMDMRVKKTAITSTYPVTIKVPTTATGGIVINTEFTASLVTAFTTTSANQTIEIQLKTASGTIDQIEQGTTILIKEI